ncbi:MAG: alpha-amylase family glycosyl hydrolase, partial [Chitinophagales bacterium]
MKWKYSLFILFVIALAACRKDKTANPNDSNSNDTLDYSTPFKNVPATEDIVMYEINIGAFSSTKNLTGITNRLDSIRALGINTIWLMPIYPVGIVNSFGSPYCVRDYNAVNSNLGTMDDLRMLVSEAHKRNIAVILDWVANHTSWDNVWIIHKSWYTQDGNGNIISPPGTNWHDVADLNYDNDTMRLAMIAAMKFWITNANVDGFRCDAADYVPFDFWQQAIDSLDLMQGRNLILLAEGSRADHFTAGFQMNYAWDYLSTLKTVFQYNESVNTIYTTNTNEYSVVPSGKRKLRFTTNHDESNIATPPTVFINKDGALAASVITIYLQGVPLIYCGQEVGVSSTSTYSGGLIDWSMNPDMLAAYKQLLLFYDSSAAARKGDLTTFSDHD